MHLSEQDAKKMGIADPNFLGTVSLESLGIPRGGGSPPSRKDSRDANRKAAADELARRLELERQGTTELVTQLKLVGIPEPRSLLHPLGQLKFHPERKWRFDLAWEDRKLAVELQGFGTHSSAKGLLTDTEKACEAVMLRWTVLPLLFRDVRSGKALRWIEKAYHQMSPLGLGQTTK